MSQRTLSNLPASVRQRLLNLSRQRGESFDLILARYANERLLYRLSQSSYADDFILKGAMLFTLWQGEPHRPTRDVDMLGFGAPDSERLEQIFYTLCLMECEPDGMIFDPDSIQVDPIRGGQEYGGLRITLQSRLEQAHIPLQIDVGFGDTVVPPARRVAYPTLLDFPSPKLRVYPRETVVAEKMQAMVSLGMLNSRMKDFYDLWTLLRTFEFDGELLKKAIIATFRRRSTPIPATLPVALSEQFATNQNKTKQWSAFISRSKLQAENVALIQVVRGLRDFLDPVLIAIRQKTTFEFVWYPNGPWTPKSPQQS